MNEKNDIYIIKKLAVMGTRSLVDMFEKLGDIGGFEQKLKALVDDGFISKRQKKFLNSS